jgi:hypothetical protein
MADPQISTSDPGPKAVAVAGMGQSEEFSLADQIARDKYIRANAAGTVPGGFFGIRRCKFVPHGSVLGVGYH